MSLKHFLHRLNRRDIPFFPFFRFPKYSKFVIFTLLLIFSAYLTHKIYAQNIILEKQEAFKQGNNQEAWVNNATATNMVTGINILAGEIPEDALNVNYELRDEEADPSLSSWVPGGLIGMSNNLIASVLDNPPASGVEYLAQVKNDFLGKPAYAQSQGIGFRGLQPILPMWRYFRNLVYSLVSVYFVIVGIMIMLKVKISPQATISIQNSIPRIFTTIILVTFSYAIAGLLIDFMYVIQSIGLYIMFQIRGTPLTENLIPTGTNTFEALNQANLTRHFNLLARFIFRTDHFMLLSSASVLTGAWAGISGAIAGVTFGGFTVLGVGLATGVLAGLFFLLVLLLFILYQLLTLLFGLFKCYVTLIFQIIFAPILIATGIFPGSKTDFSAWLKQIMANILVFPAVYLFLVFMNVLIFTISKGYGAGGSELAAMAANPNNLTGELWAPGILSWGLRGFGVQLALSLVGFLVASKIPVLLPQVLFNIKPSPWGQAMEQSYAGIMKSPVGGFMNKNIQKFGRLKEEATELDIKKRAADYEDLGGGLSRSSFEAQTDITRAGSFFSLILGKNKANRRMSPSSTPSKGTK